MPQTYDSGSEVGSGTAAARVAHRAYVPETGWGAIAATCAAVVMFGAAMAVAASGMQIFTVLTGARAPGAAAAGALDTERTRHIALWMALFQIALIAMTVLAARAFKSNWRATLAWRQPEPDARAYLVAGVCLLGFGAVFAAAMWVWNRDVVLADLRPFHELLTVKGGWVLLPVIAIGAPLAEEFLFRGFLFSALAKSRLGLIGAALISTAAWTALHAGYSVYGLAEVFLVGLYLCFVLVKSGSLRVPIACHIAYNGAVALTLLAVELPK